MLDAIVARRRTETKIMTERVESLRESGRTTIPHADGERARLFTESWRETEGQSLPLRRAQAFRRCLEGVTPVIFDGELIVGSPTKFRCGGQLPIEYISEDGREIAEGRAFTMSKETEAGSVSAEDAEAIAEAYHFWAGKSTSDLLGKRWSEILGEEFVTGLKRSRVGLMVGQGAPPSPKTADYPKVLARGLRGLIADAQQRIARLDYRERDAVEKRDTLQAMIISLEGMIRFAQRYAELAAQKAQEETDPVRRGELLKIAEICTFVPGNPPRSFWEALQFFWFVHLGMHMEFASGHETPGRMDQYLYPYYERDINGGTLTRDRAGELLACVFVKMNDRTRFEPGLMQEFRQGNPGQNVVVGGVTAEGRDATNELSFLILEVASQLKLKQPGIYIRWHAGIDERLLMCGVETNIETKGGIPAFINDHNVVPNLMALGISLADARNYCTKGCVHPMVPGTHMFAGPIAPSPVKMFEMTLNNGVDPLIGKQIGLATGDPRSFTSYEQLVDAFKQQFTHWMKKLVQAWHIYHQTRVETACYPFLSAVQRDCIEAGKDIGSTEVGYPVMYSAVNLRGLQTLVNSLAAVKKLVFDEQRVSMDELLAALAKNFEGYDELRQMCLAAPKWGNNDDYVDRIHADLWNFTAEAARREFVTPWGGAHLIRGGATFHYFAGRSVGATCDGRKAFEPLADGTVSASYGTDTRGPTAVINSALKLNHSRSISSLFNLKFPATLLTTEADRKKLLALLRTYFEEGGYHLQFNIMGSEMLLDAQKHPERYRDLIVRVAGFSAYFVDLPLPVQNEIIGRTEQTL